MRSRQEPCVRRSSPMGRAHAGARRAACALGYALLSVGSPWAACAAEPSAPSGGMEGARSVVYRQVGSTELRLYLFMPTNAVPTTSRSAIVFFFGGGWRGGSVAQFRPQAERLAARGMVAICAEYRVYSRHGATIRDCVEDAKSAIRWVRAHAVELGVVTNRIVAAGGSAGGHLAACTGIVPGFEAPDEDLRISSRPDALVLFNPVCVLAPVPDIFTEGTLRLNELAQRAGTNLVALSPYHHVAPGQPPCLIFHGRADEVVPYRTAELFAEAMMHAGNTCRLVGFDGRGHGFFNPNRDGGRWFEETYRQMEEFLERLGFLPQRSGPVAPTNPT